VPDRLRDESEKGPFVAVIMLGRLVLFDVVKRVKLKEIA